MPQLGIIIYKARLIDVARHIMKFKGKRSRNVRRKQQLNMVKIIQAISTNHIVKENFIRLLSFDKTFVRMKLEKLIIVLCEN